MILGYKCFNKGLVNNYGKQFKVGAIYHTNGDVSFGNNGNGFHMCERLQDTLKFFDTFNNEVDICEVIGYGKCVKRDDEFYDFFDMYCCENIKIVKKLSRDEIVLYGLNLDEINVLRFISLYKLNSDEELLFREKFKSNSLVNKYIDYYQDGIKTVFTNDEKTMKLRKVE